ncbi:MAG: hypothetical protein EOQ41_07285 [Mesorhizobium sp.]|nr:MAG: hypothetical protein EOQ41_07285 [Mesorhizobium sp.]RWD42006.1 MAG: hypothetical protein EOS35_26015 [Mesorhizobium sp.]
MKALKLRPKEGKMLFLSDWGPYQTTRSSSQWKRFPLGTVLETEPVGRLTRLRKAPSLLEAHPEHLPKRLMIHKPMKGPDGKIHWFTERFRG